MEQPQFESERIVDAGRPHGVVQALFERLAVHRGPRRALACLECGIVRVVGRDAGECPACGYLGWREPGGRGDEAHR